MGKRIIDLEESQQLSSGDYIMLDNNSVGSTKFDISSISSDINTCKSNLSKNIIPYPYMQTTRTINGVTFTDNGDGSITVSGTATGNAVYILHGWTIEDGSIPLDVSMRYTLSGCPQNGSNSTYALCARLYASGVSPSSSTGIIARDTGSGITYNYPYAYMSPYIAVWSGTAITTPITFYPMLRYSNITDNTYSKYGDESVIPSLTNGLSELSNKIDGKLTKNLLPYPYTETTHTQSGITFTDNKDGSITVNGTATANSEFAFFGMASGFKLPYGDYIIDQPDGASASTYRFRVDGYLNNTYQKSYVVDSATNITILESDEFDSLQCVFIVYSGQTVTNLTFRPMIRYAAISDDTYSEYGEESVIPLLANETHDIKNDINELNSNRIQYFGRYVGYPICICSNGNFNCIHIVPINNDNRWGTAFLSNSQSAWYVYLNGASSVVTQLSGTTTLTVSYASASDGYRMEINTSNPGQFNAIVFGSVCKNVALVECINAT